MNQQQGITEGGNNQCKFCVSKISKSTGKDICVSCVVITMILKHATTKSVFDQRFPNKKALKYWRKRIGDIEKNIQPV